MSRMSASADTWRWSGQFSDLTSSPHRYDAKSSPGFGITVLFFSAAPPKQTLFGWELLDSHLWLDLFD